MSKVAHNFQDKARTGDVLISESVDFSSLLLSDLVLKGLKNSGFIRPSPIQLKAIPLGRCGLDLIVQAKSGTGKTCVFSVVALESILTDTASTQVLVLAPTREIAVQTWEVINSLGSAMTDLQCHTFIGGLPLHEDRLKLKKCHIAVGSPGRIKQLIEGGVLKTDSVRLFILDEADKLLEESFQEQINWIYSTLPENKQMLALSATYPEYLADHLTAYMRNPTFLRLNISDPALLGIRQYYHTVPYHPMSHVVFEEKSKVLSNILSSVSFQQCLVFSNLQTRAQTLADSLTSLGWPTACIAGCLQQKDRSDAMARLKTYKCRILISTDLTSRGIDADKVNVVVNLDVPKDHETYLHRIGRAGRFGSFGIAVSLISEGQERLNLDAIEKRCNTQIYPLPDPLPSDLAKPDCPIFLDDVVSTEVINTEKLKLKREENLVNQKVMGPIKPNNASDIKPCRINETSSTVFTQKENKKEKDDQVCEVTNRNVSDFVARKDITSTIQDAGMIEKPACETDLYDDDLEDPRTAVCYEGVEYDEICEELKIGGSIRGDFGVGKKFVKSSWAINRSSSDNGLSEYTSKITNKTKVLEKDPIVECSSSQELDKDEITEKNIFNQCQLEMKSTKLECSGNDEEQSHGGEIVVDGSKTENENQNIEVQFRTLTLNSKCRPDRPNLPLETINISDIFQHSIGFQKLNNPHLYCSARESLKEFRAKYSDEMLEDKFDCSLPKSERDNTEEPQADKLGQAIAQLQDMLENHDHLTVYSTKSFCEPMAPEALNNTTDISSNDEFEAKEEVLVKGIQDLLQETLTVSVDHTKIVHGTADKKDQFSDRSADQLEPVEENDISSEDEFEAKEEVLQGQNKAFQHVNAADNIGDTKCVHECMENKQTANQPNGIEDGRLKKEVIKKTQKARKQRFGYQGSFSIGHLLQQEREQNSNESENARSEVRDYNAAEDVSELVNRRKLIDSDVSQQVNREKDIVGDISEIANREKVGDISEEVDKKKMINGDESELVNRKKEIIDDILSRYYQASETSKKTEKETKCLTSSRKDENENGQFSRVLKEDQRQINGRFTVDCNASRSRNNEVNYEDSSENDSETSSVSSASSSESDQVILRDPGAIPKTSNHRSKSASKESWQAGFAAGQSHYPGRDNFSKSDAKSEDSAVYSRPSYQEQWQQWCKLHENWQHQSMAMWGYPGMYRNHIHEADGRMNMADYGYWNPIPPAAMHTASAAMYPPSATMYTPSMYTPYQFYQQGYPYDYSMYQNSNKPDESNSNLTEQLGHTFQMQNEYIKKMSKFQMKGKKLRK